MTCMLKSITLPWRTAKPFTAHTLLCSSRKLQPHLFILVTMVFVLLALPKAASAKEEVLIKYDYDTLNDVKRDHAYVGDDVRFEVKSNYSDLVIGASTGYECVLELETVEYTMTNHNGTYSWTKACIEENFYYYIRPRGAEQCKFGIVEVGTDDSENENLPTSHSKMKSPIKDTTEDNGEKCEDGFVKKDGECYESSYRLTLIIVHSVVGGIIVGGLFVWFIVWRRRRRSKMSSEESALPKAPPTTGDVPGDASSTVVASAPTDIVIGRLSGAESNNAMSELNNEPSLGQALNAPAGVADAPSTEPSAPDFSELVVKTDTDDPPTYEEATNMALREGP